MRKLKEGQTKLIKIVKIVISDLSGICRNPADMVLKTIKYIEVFLKYSIKN